MASREREEKGNQREPKGSQREPKGSQREAKWEPKRAKGVPQGCQMGCQNDTETDPPTFQQGKGNSKSTLCRTRAKHIAKNRWKVTTYTKWMLKKTQHRCHESSKSNDKIGSEQNSWNSSRIIFPRCVKYMQNYSANSGF